MIAGKLHMPILNQLDRWHAEQKITEQQHALFTSLIRQQPFSVYTELNLLLYAGVLALVGGLGWTVTVYSKQLGDITIVAALTLIVVTSLVYCFRKAPAWSPQQTQSRTFLSDYVLYLCCLVWLVELTYLQSRFHLFTGRWDNALLATALLFFALAYRFDNRFVLSLALSSLAGWCGFTLARLPVAFDQNYREYALAFCVVVFLGAVALHRINLKRHFFPTYLNLVTNILLLALLSGVFDSEDLGFWFIALLAASAVSAVWGIRNRDFAFVLYASVYTYIASASMLLRLHLEPTGTFFFLLVGAIAMLVMLVTVSRGFGRTQ